MHSSLKGRGLWSQLHFAHRPSLRHVKKTEFQRVSTDWIGLYSATFNCCCISPELLCGLCALVKKGQDLLHFSSTYTTSGTDFKLSFTIKFSVCAKHGWYPHLVLCIVATICSPMSVTTATTLSVMPQSSVMRLWALNGYHLLYAAHGKFGFPKPFLLFASFQWDDMLQSNTLIQY